MQVTSNGRVRRSQSGARGRLVWADKSERRFRDRVREITRRDRGHRVETVIAELMRYVRGWLNYFALSHTYQRVVDLGQWIRRRIRLYYWKQWKQPAPAVVICSPWASAQRWCTWRHAVVRVPGG